jgi:deoxyribonuclease-1-like protein
LHRPPFVGWFRVRGPPPDQAFTFTLVNVHTDPDEVAEEMRVLDDVFFKVRDDGRNEDDLILLGDFNADDQHLDELGRVSGMMAAISRTPTNTRQTQQYDNLVFQFPATSEYAGRSGVFDFLREFNLTIEQALQVSDHLPVWAEFSMHEGGVVPAVAASDAAPDVR